MRSSFASAALSALLPPLLLLPFFPIPVLSAPQFYCPEDDICFQVAVPSTSASSSSGPIYFQLRAPTSYSWVAMAQGSSMAGANMFLMYTDGSGNVTVSPRAGTGYVMPEEDPDVQVTLLEGSGVFTEEGGSEYMQANVECGNCQSWQDGEGEMSYSDTSAGFVAAWLQGQEMATQDTGASIGRHDDHAAWTLDLRTATVEGEGNPFIAEEEEEEGGGNGDGNGDGGNGGGQDGGSDGDEGGDSSSPGVVAGPGEGGGPSAELERISSIITAHGIIMAVVMVILYPLGSALMPLFGKWAMHAAWQAVSFVLMWVAFALGYVAAERVGIDFNSTHTLLGTVVVCLFVLQPVLGYVHHRHFLRHGGRGVVSHAHIWYGRALMVLGVVNGGLGLQLARAGRSFKIAYAVVAAVVFVIYAAAKAFGVVKGRRGAAGGQANGTAANGAGRRRGQKGPRV